MAPTIPHILLSVHGNLPGGETWSCGLRSLAWATDLGPTAGPALAVAVSNRWRTMAGANGFVARLFGNSTANQNPATIDGVTVRRLNEDGVTVEQYEGSPTTALVTNGNGENYPNQCALVVTLVTARAGRTGKGRIYLPCMQSLGITGGRIPPSTVTQIATAVKACLDGMNTDLRTATDPGQKLAVQSSKASQEPGVWTPGAPSGYMGASIVSIRIGDTIDTQRRRRSSIAESYATAQLV